MTKAKIKINLNEILKFIKFAGSMIPTEHYSWDSEKYDWIEALNEVIKIVEQEPKTGHWIDRFPAKECKCSVCDFLICISNGSYTDMVVQMKYCPNCGAKMVEPQESEEV